MNEDLRNVLRALYVFTMADNFINRALLAKALEKALGEDDASSIQEKLLKVFDI